jgi:hypothetical protein
VFHTPQFNWGNEFQKEGLGGNGLDVSSVETKKLGATPYEVVNSGTYVHYNDYYYSEHNQHVAIVCGPKGVNVRAMLTRPVSLAGSATWKNWVNVAAGSFAGLIGTADFFARIVSPDTVGTLRQPWLSREMWDGSAPLKLELNLRLLAVGSYAEASKNRSTYPGFTDVYLPACQLMSLIYPGKTGAGAEAVYTPPGPSPVHAIAFETAYKEGQKSGSKVVGHPVDVQIGNFVWLQSCYVTSCNVTFDTTLDEGGFPHSADVSMQFSTFEAPYVNLEAVGKNETLPFSFAPLEQGEETFGANAWEMIKNVIQVGKDIVTEMIGITKILFGE